ncbi:ubiquitin-like domain-containing protein [Tepidiforma sp.]|uniref:ubiquitin-like domain-containing protein n=1 Tax=Tepidiforma sp. TaxID=2682230 RepID=UPI002ADE88FF|nr:ubiquitin-like domain-containing protein [Tepidiforma sp.]
MAQALSRPFVPSRLHLRRRQFVRRARARLFRARHHTAAVLAVAVVMTLGSLAYPLRATLVVSDAGARVYRTVFPGEVASLPGLDDVALRQARTFDANGLAGIGILRARTATVSADGREVVIHSRASTIGGLLAEAGIVLGPRDRVLLDGVVANPSTPLTGVRFTATSGAVPVPTVPTITVQRARRYTVFIDNLRVDVQSPASNVGELVADLGLVIREADLVEPPPETPLLAGTAVRLAPARTIAVVLDGVGQVLYTRAGTVGEVLQLLELGDATIDSLSHDVDAYLAAGSTLVVGTIRTVREEVIEPLPPAILTEEDPALPRGQVRLTPGEAGELRVVYESTYRNGVLERRETLLRTVVRPPVAARQIIGTRDVNGEGHIVHGPDYSGPYRKKVTVWATWYNASHGPWKREDPSYGRTATGVIVDRGVCAVDPEFIPLGTRFVVPGYGLCIAADVGGGIKGWKVDLGFPEDAGPNPWRTGSVDIYILD